MNLTEATKVGTVTDVLVQIQLFKIIITLILPLIIILVIIAIIVRHENKTKTKISRQKTTEEKRKTVSKPFKTADEMFNSLSDIGEPFDKSKYRSLDLTFNNRGKAVIMEDNSNG